MISTDRLEARLRERDISFEWVGGPPGGIEAVRVDSREVAPGDLFCAIVGTVADGHDFVGSAANRGAAAAVVERPVDASIPLLRVESSRAAAAHLASLAAGDPARRLRLTGVTGTNGKTTTTLLLRHLLGSLAPAAALGTLGLWRPDGSLSARGRITTPGPVELHADLTEAVDLGARWLAMEVSSHALDQQRVEGLSFEAAVFTNLSREHLDYHSDMVEYRAAKLRILDLLAPDGVAVVNADDRAWDVPAFGGRRVVKFGTAGSARDAAYRAADVRHTNGGSRWTLVTPHGRADVELPLIGAFNVSNALGAAAAACELGCPLDAVAEALGRAPHVPGRMEVLARPPAPLVVRDYAHTPDGLTRALAALRELCDGRLTVVFGCGGDRDRGKRPMMGERAVAGADRVILTADNPRTEPLERIIGDILQFIDDADVEVIHDRAEAIAAAVAEAGPADAVLLAGKGHETYQDVKGEKRPFDEAAIVRALLGGAGG